MFPAGRGEGGGKGLSVGQMRTATFYKAFRDNVISPPKDRKKGGPCPVCLTKILTSGWAAAYERWRPSAGIPKRETPAHLLLCSTFFVSRPVCPSAILHMQTGRTQQPLGRRHGEGEERKKNQRKLAGDRRSELFFRLAPCQSEGERKGKKS